MSEAYDKLQEAAEALTDAIRTFLDGATEEEKESIYESYPAMKLSVFPTPSNLMEYIAKKQGNTPMLWLRGLKNGDVEIATNMERDIAVKAFLAKILADKLLEEAEAGVTGGMPSGLKESLNKGNFSVIEGEDAERLIEKLARNERVTDEEISKVLNKADDGPSFLDKVLKGLPDAPPPSDSSTS